ncbi:MAG: MarR family winged helix-turn-helix transcriptional regulator [Oscillospiraceae bacterium]
MTDSIREGDSLSSYVRDISHELYYRTEQALRERGVTNQQARVLAVIYKEAAAGREPTRRDLEHLMHLRGPTITVLVNSLERGDYLTRRIRRSDGRIRALILTPKGEALVKEVREVFSIMESELLEALTEGERQTMMNLLAKLSASIPDHPERRLALLKENAKEADDE